LAAVSVKDREGADVLTKTIATYGLGMSILPLLRLLLGMDLLATSSL